MAVDTEPDAGANPRRFFALAPLVRAPGIASDPKKLILAVLGLLAMTAGWSALDRAFGDPGGELVKFEPAATIRAFEDSPTPGDLARLVSEPARAVIVPFAGLFTRQDGHRDWARTALHGLWALVVWGIAGGAIARIAVVRAAGGPGVGLITAARFALGRSVSLIAAPMTPLLVVAVFAAGCAAFGLLYRLPGGVGAMVASALGFLPLIAGLVMALILLGLAFGWPLMVATVAAEGEDAPDALSRSYSYVNQRLPRYVVHAAIAWGIGIVGLIAAILFARGVLGLSGWGIGLGAPGNTGPYRLVEDSREFWDTLVAWLVHGWIYSYFWTAAAILYLILRRDVDGTDWHDVYLPSHDADAFAPAPGPAKAVEAEVG